MDVVYERCCGLDIHKKTVVACLIIPGSSRKTQKAIRTFGTMTDDLLALADWLAEHEVTHVAMESTGVYWKPIWNLLEDRFELLLVNAQHLKTVPGRKTDVKDSEWIADLLRHGLLKASFVPDRPQRELRELTRYRAALLQDRAAEVNRLQQTLEGANIKLAAVATDVLGKSGREILAALVAGDTAADALAQLAKGRLREKIPQLERALTGRVGPHQRFLVARHLAQIDAFDETVTQVSAEIAERLRPVDDDLSTCAEVFCGPTRREKHVELLDTCLERLDTIPGVGRRTAEVIVAELGTDMERFPTAGHAASWAGMCPGNNESAGKRKSGKTRKGNPALRTALAEAAHGAARKRACYLAAQYHRLAARRGKKKALIGVGHTILVIAYHLLKHGGTYEDLGANYFDERDRQAVARRLIRRLEALGYDVTPRDSAA